MNARDYAKVYLTYWTGTTGQRITTPEAKLVGLYLFTGPHVMLTHSGVWRIDEDTVEEHTSIKPEAYRAALGVLEAAGLIELDQRRKWIWVREFAMFQLCGQGRPNAPSPDIKKCWSEFVALSRQCPDLADRWYERYESDLYLRDSASVEAVRLGKRTAEIPRGKSADSKKPIGTQSESSRTQSESRRTQSAPNPIQGAPNPIQGEVNQNQGELNQVQSGLNQNQGEVNTSILYQDTVIGSEVHRVIGSEGQSHAREPEPSVASVKPRREVEPSRRERAMRLWLEERIDDRVRVLVGNSVAEMFPELETHYDALRTAATSVVDAYRETMRKEGLNDAARLTGKSLQTAVMRALMALSEDGEMPVADAVERLALHVEWFATTNPKRKSRDGKDWLSDPVAVFGGKESAQSAAGNSRNVHDVMRAHLSESASWLAERHRQAELEAQYAAEAASDDLPW